MRRAAMLRAVRAEADDGDDEWRWHDPRQQAGATDQEGRGQQHQMNARLTAHPHTDNSGRRQLSVAYMLHWTVHACMPRLLHSIWTALL